MNLQHLHFFVAVAELLSFQRAAERLHISRPPLTRQIQALEADLGVRLLERGRRREITLTAAGKTFLADAKQVLAGLEAARRHAREHARGATGRLSIASHSTVSARVLPACLKAFRQEFPHVEVSIVEMRGEAKLDGVRDGGVDVAFAADFGPIVAAQLRSEALVSVGILAVLPQAHPVARASAAEIDLRALSGDVLLYLPATNVPCYTQRLPEICRLAGLTPRGLRAVEGLDNLLAMVAAGYGVAVLPDIFDGLLDASLSSKRLRLPVPAYRLSLVWRPGAVPPVLENFLRIARRFAQPMPAVPPRTGKRARTRVMA